MAIRVHPAEPASENLSFLGSERCCFCRDTTRYWHKPSDVAVCQSCAKVFNVSDIPDKRLWCEREHLIWQSVQRFGNPKVPCCFCRDLLPIPEQKFHAPICLRCKQTFPDSSYPSWQQWAEKEEKIRKGVKLLSQIPKPSGLRRKPTRSSPLPRQTRRA